MTNRPIYLDHQATTPLDPRVLEEMLPYLTTAYGNPNSAHAYGREAAKAVATARRRVAHLIGAKNPIEVIFTSGATEANHLAIVGGALAKRPAAATSSPPRSSTRPSSPPSNASSTTTATPPPASPSTSTDESSPGTSPPPSPRTPSSSPSCTQTTRSAPSSGSPPSPN